MRALAPHSAVAQLDPRTLLAFEVTLDEQRPSCLEVALDELDQGLGIANRSSVLIATLDLTGRANVVLETTESVAVAFDTPVVELLTDAGLRRSQPLRELGPDLLGPDFDAGEALRRLRERDAMELGNALLDQRAAAGIGNVVKSEVAFLERLDPWTSVGLYSDDELLAALATARRVLRANTGGGARNTTGSRNRGAALWVYGRAGRPCRRCGTIIRTGRQGELARTTYWCPRCQAPPTPRSG